MPEYGYSTAYRGMSGGALPPGALEAMTAPGRNIGRGIEKIGEGIAQSIERYQKNKSEFEYARGDVEGLIAQYLPKAKALPSGETGGFDMEALANIVGERNVKKFVEGKASTSDMLAMAHSIKTAQAEKDRALGNEVKRLQIDAYKRQQEQDVEAINQGRIANDVARYAMSLPDMATREVQTTSMQPQGSPQLRSVVAGYMDKARSTIPALNAAVLNGSANAAMGGWPAAAQEEAVSRGALAANAIGALEKMPATQALPMVPVTSTNTVSEPIGYDTQRKMLADYAIQSGAKPEIFAALDNLLSIAGKRQPMQIGVQQLPGNLGSVVTAGNKTEIIKPDTTAQARMVQGFQGVAPTEKEAIDFRKMQSDAAITKDLSDSLIALSTHPKAMVDPALRTQGANLSAQLAARLRPFILGPGTVTDSEREILMGLAANPATIFSLNSKTRASLETLKSKIDKAMEEQAKSLGLSPVGQSQTQGGLPRVKFNPALQK